MAEVTLYGLKSCDTCRKALAALQAAGRAPVFVDLREGADLAAKVPEWRAAAGADALVNRRSTTWRGLDAAERAAAGGDGVDALLVAHPTLIKRPVIETGDGAVHVGWAGPVQAALLG